VFVLGRQVFFFYIYVCLQSLFSYFFSPYFAIWRLMTANPNLSSASWDPSWQATACGGRCAYIYLFIYLDFYIAYSYVCACW
jgi:hypothetical protein